MNNLLTSFFVGFSCTLGLFLFSLITVAGIKSVYFFILSFFQSKKEDKPKPKKRPPRKPIKSIEINPDEVDRIVVKKAS